MYRRLLRSFIGLFLDRGYSVQLAKVQASFALSCWLTINAVSIVLATSPSTARKAFAVLPERTIYWFLFVLALAGLNWLAARSIPAQPAVAETAGVATARPIQGRRLWLWYVAVSGVVLVVALARATAD